MQCICASHCIIKKYLAGHKNLCNENNYPSDETEIAADDRSDSSKSKTCISCCQYGWLRPPICTNKKVKTPMLTNCHSSTRGLK